MLIPRGTSELTLEEVGQGAVRKDLVGDAGTDWLQHADYKPPVTCHEMCDDVSFVKSCVQVRSSVRKKA